MLQVRYEFAEGIHANRARGGRSAAWNYYVTDTILLEFDRIPYLDVMSRRGSVKIASVWRFIFVALATYEHAVNAMYVKKRYMTRGGVQPRLVR